MSDYAIPYGRPLNPEFGKGIFRRRIRLQNLPGKVIAELEDCNHGFRSVVHHDGERVTAIEPESIRTPLVTCFGATALIKALESVLLATDIRALSKTVNPKSNCTHLYDLTVLAMHHALRADPVRQYDVVIPDEVNDHAVAVVALNGVPILRWQVGAWVLRNPEFYGVSLAKGFGEWASKYYNGDQREAAFVLQKGYLVSNARRFDMSQLQGLPVTAVDAMTGACYSYAPEMIEHAVRAMNVTRDFTDCEEKLLTFE